MIGMKRADWRSDSSFRFFVTIPQIPVCIGMNGTES